MEADHTKYFTLDLELLLQSPLIPCEAEPIAASQHVARVTDGKQVCQKGGEDEHQARNQDETER
jgi:hypothetical protein